MKKALFIFLISCRFVTSGISQTIPPFVSANGLIGWWPFNGNADDESMNGNEGQVHGAKLTTNRFDKPNKAYSFNGIYDYITVDILNSTLQLKNNFSFSVWVYLNYNSNSSPYIISKGDLSSNEYSLGCSDSQFLFFDKPDHHHLTNISFNNFYNTWTNITCIIDNGNSKIYVNGKQMSNTILNKNILPSNLALTFGALFEIGTNTPIRDSYFTGKLDDIGFWNRVLNEEEILLLYKNDE